MGKSSLSDIVFETCTDRDGAIRSPEHREYMILDRCDMSEMIRVRPKLLLPTGHIGGYRGFPNLRSLPINMYSNPLDPGVVVEPKVRFGKAKKKNPQEKLQEEPKEKPKENAHKPNAANPPRNAPATSKEDRQLKLDRSRAKGLKKTFPSMAMNIPESLTAQEKRELCKEWKVAGIKPKPPKRSMKFETKTKNTGKLSSIGSNAL